jgi:lysine 6-dehydrogenase
MRVALLGAGIIGDVIARDLATWDPPDEVRVGDVDGTAAGRVADEHGFDATSVDVTDTAALDRYLDGCDVVCNAAQYHVNLPVMGAAARVGCNYLDLGGLFHTTRRQLELDDTLREAGVTAVLGMGSCPGIANVHAGDLAGRLDAVHGVRIYNASTTDTSDSLRWPYSIRTILDEMTRPAVVFRDGTFVERPPLSGEETFDFHPPIGRAEVHLSIHSEVATIPLSLRERGIRECAFLINRFGFSAGAFEKLRLLVDLGLAATDARKVRVPDGDDVEVVPREMLIALLEEADPPPPEHVGFKDIATLATGTRDGEEVRLRLDTTAWPSEELGVAGGTVVVAAPAAIIARWLASGALDRPGVHPPETAVDPAPFYSELARRGCSTTLEETTTLAEGG